MVKAEKEGHPEKVNRETTSLRETTLGVGFCLTKPFQWVPSRKAWLADISQAETFFCLNPWQSHGFRPQDHLCLQLQGCLRSPYSFLSCGFEHHP